MRSIGTDGNLRTGDAKGSFLLKEGKQFAKRKISCLRVSSDEGKFFEFDVLDLGRPNGKGDALDLEQLDEPAPRKPAKL